MKPLCQSSAPILSTTKLSANRIFLQSTSLLTPSLNNNPNQQQQQQQSAMNNSFHHSNNTCNSKSPTTIFLTSRTEPMSGLTVCTDNLAKSSNSNIDPSFLLYASSSAASPLSTSSLSSSSSTLLDDSLTSLTWLQNLNIMKSAHAAVSDDLTSTTINNNNNNIKQQSPNTSMLNEPEINKPFELTDNEPAPNQSKIPTTTTTTTNTTASASNKLTCLTVDSEIQFTPSASSSPNSSSSFLQQVSFPLSPPISSSSPPAPTTTPATKTKSTKRQTSSTKTGGTQSGKSRPALNNQQQQQQQSQQQQQQQSSASTFFRDREEFRQNSSVKPPYSYSQLIILAMKESNRSKMTLQMIYDWIIDNFSYFKKADASWQITFKNSIRHNLSLNKCFKKIARQKEEPGKGGFWTLDPEFEKQLDESNNPTNNNSNSNNFQSCSNENKANNSFFNLSLNKRRRNTLSKPKSLLCDSEKTPTLQKSLSSGNGESEFQHNFNTFESNQLLTKCEEDLMVKKPKVEESCVFYGGGEGNTMPFLNGASDLSLQGASVTSRFDAADLDASSDGNHVSSLLLRADANWATSNNNNLHPQMQSFHYSCNDSNRLISGHSDFFQTTASNNFFNGQFLSGNEKNSAYFVRPNSCANQHNAAFAQQLGMANEQAHHRFHDINHQHGQVVLGAALNNSCFDENLSKTSNYHNSYSGHHSIDPEHSSYPNHHHHHHHHQHNHHHQNHNHHSHTTHHQNPAPLAHSGAHHSTNPSSNGGLIIEDMAGTFSCYANEIIKTMDEAALFTLEEGLEFDKFDIDQLEEATNDVINENTFKLIPAGNEATKCVQKVDEFVNEYMKISKSSMSPCVSKAAHSDAELIDLFEYTSQFGMIDDANIRNHHNPVDLLNDSSSLSSSPSSSSSSSSSSTTPSSSSLISADKLNKPKVDLVIEGHGIKQPKWWSESTTFEPQFRLVTNQQRGAPGDDDECDSSNVYTQYMTYHHNHHHNHSLPNPSVVDLKDIFDTGATLSFDQSFNLISSSFEPPTQQQQQQQQQTIKLSQSDDSVSTVFNSPFELVTQVSKTPETNKKRTYSNRNINNNNNNNQKAEASSRPVPRTKKEKLTFDSPQKKLDF